MIVENIRFKRNSIEHPASFQWNAHSYIAERQNKETRSYFSGQSVISDLPLFCRSANSLSRSIANPSSPGVPSLVNPSCKSNGDSPKAGRWLTYTVKQPHGNISTYHLLTESEVITGKSQTEASMYCIKVEVWDFPVMTERTRLISYLLYGLFALQ